MLLSSSAAAADQWAPGPGATPDDSIVGFVDQPGANVNVMLGSRLVIRGWVVDKTAQGWAGVDKLMVYDGEPTSATILAQGSVGIERQDVAQAFGNPYWAKSGFEAVIDTSNLSVGQHFRTYVPYMLALFAGLLLIICIPEISLTLPRLAGLIR